MKKLISVFFLLIPFFLLVLIIPVSIYGQSYQMFRSELKQVIERARWRIGPFRIYPTIQLRNIGYDNNVYRQREEDNPISDYTATFSPQVKVYLLFRNYLILSLTENPEYVYYFKQRRERRWNNSLSPEFKLLFLNRFVIGGSYLNSSRRYRASSEFDVQANVKVKGYRGHLFYETARNTSFGFSGTINKISFEDVTMPGEEIYLSRALNREEKGGNFEFYYRVFSESFFFITAGYTEYKFEYIQSRWRDSYSYQAYSGIRFPLFGRMTGTFSLGYKKLLSEREGKKGFSGLVGNTRLDFRVGYFGFRFQYNRDCRFSYYTNNVFFLEERYGTGISFYLSRFLRLDYNFTYGKSNYPELITIRLPDENYEEIKRQDSYRIHTVGFAIRIIRNTGIGVRANFWERDSNIPFVGRNSWFLGVYVTSRF